MNFRIFIGIVYFFAFSQILNAQNNKREYVTKRIENPPKIDGILDDKAWINAPSDSLAYQYEPYNNKKSSQNTLVKLVYADAAVYVSAMLYEHKADSISTNLCKRDEANDANVDLFKVIFIPYNDGINAFEFAVTASGVQNDARHSAGNMDKNWDAVWKSAVNMTDSGWIAEMEIPFSALRFPKIREQTWGLHFFRFINHSREWDSWNFVSKENEDIISQAGVLKGISEIKPPVRLSVTPYVSGYLLNNPDNKAWQHQFKAGMDLKYGISESFTLDMILIPDFGQVQSDDKILNLSPFEINYEEKRPFFTEGNELFSKANIFYSRRVGGKPHQFDEVEERKDSTEEIVYNANHSPLLNATKISGRLSGGLGIGFFNGITGEAIAELKDTISGEMRDLITQPFTNYNILVFDQSLRNNSYASIINTNLRHSNSNYWANVTGTEFELINKNQEYEISGMFNFSLINNEEDSLVNGHLFNLELEKIKGKFLFEAGIFATNDRYDHNDMGFLSRNNEFVNYLELKYNIYDPFWKVLRWQAKLSAYYNQLYDSGKYTGSIIEFNTHTTFRNHLSTGILVFVEPFEQHDYFEARKEGVLFIDPAASTFRLWISSDYRKTFALDINAKYLDKSGNDDQSINQLRISPRIRPNNQMLFVYNFDREFKKNNIGYTNTEKNGAIIFGKRNQTTLTNTVDFTYIFTNTASLSFRLRHYWSRLLYHQYYELQNDGYLSNPLGLDYYADGAYDYNFNSFNIDFLFVWHFAPGSELSFAWKNIIDDPDVPMVEKYFSNLNNVFESSLSNSLSLKVLYYLDYNHLKRRVSK